MEVLYLNLERRADRNARFLAVNAGLADFRRVAAVDGSQLRIEDLIEAGVVREPLRAYTPGALGAALSHKAIWDRCASGHDALTVAEDDAVFNRFFAAKAPGLLGRLPSDWDIILWGWNFDSILHVEVIEGLKQSVMHFDAEKLGDRISRFQEEGHDAIPLRLVNAFGLICYSISPKGARSLGESCFPLRNEVGPIPGLRRRLVNFGIDVMMNQYYRVLKSYVSFPPLVWTENDKAASDVSAGSGR